MTKLLLIAWQEYKRNVFKKSFILALLSVPFIIGIGIGTGILTESLMNNDAPLGYIDYNGFLKSPIPAYEDSEDAIELIPYISEEAAQSALEDGVIQGYYIIPENYGQTNEVELRYLGKKPGDNAYQQFFKFVQVNLAAQEYPETARLAAEGPEYVIRHADGSREISPDQPPFGLLAALFLCFAFVFLLMMSSGYLVQAVVEEKENRTMEVILTSISPIQLIGGKVLGVLGISLTQLVVWMAVGVGGVVIGQAAGLEFFQDVKMDWEPVLMAAVVAVPAYLLSSAVMVLLGAMLTSAEESQSVGAMFFILHILPIYFMFLFIESSHQTLATLLTFLPFTALMSFGLRNFASVVPTWQWLLIVLAQFFYAAVGLWLAGRAFRLGMLRYGQKVNLREVLKASAR